MASPSNNFVYDGEILPNGEVIKVAAAVGDMNGNPVERDNRGIYLLEHGQQFSVLLSNYSGNRQVSVDITGDDDSTVIADNLILSQKRINGVLKRWLSVDQAFIAYQRDSDAGDSVGGQSVANGGGGLLKFVFTIGKLQERRGRNYRSNTHTSGLRSAMPAGAGVREYSESSQNFRGGASTRLGALESMGIARTANVEEGVMGAGHATGQRFTQVSFRADPTLPQFEIHLRWGVSIPQAEAMPTAPPDRRYRQAPMIV